MGQWVDDGSNVMGCDYPQNLDLSGLSVNLDFSHLSAEVCYVFSFRCHVLHGHGEGQRCAVGDCLLDLRAGFHDGLTFRVGHTAGPWPLVVGNFIGITNADLDLFQGDSHLAGDHLFLNGMGASANVHGGADDGERPVFLGGQDRSGNTTADLAAKQGDAATVSGFFGLVPVASLQCCFHDLVNFGQLDGTT